MIKKFRWTDEEIKILKKYGDKLTIDELAKILPYHSKRAIYTKLLELGFKREGKVNYTELKKILKVRKIE